MSDKAESSGAADVRQPITLKTMLARLATYAGADEGATTDAEALDARIRFILWYVNDLETQLESLP